MNRRSRLASARGWLAKYSGKNLLKGYCKHFGVDWRCAALELKTLGVTIDPEYVALREASEAATVKKRRQKREMQQDEHWHSYTDPRTAYLNGDFAALHDLEQRQAAGDEEIAEGLDQDVPF